MSDESFLQWPFFNDEHQALAARLDEWASRHLPTLTADEHHDLDGTCKAIVKALGEAGFATYAVPASAGGHHEKLDGTGYPKGLTKDEMSVQARIMANLLPQ